MFYSQTKSSDELNQSGKIALRNIVNIIDNFSTNVKNNKNSRKKPSDLTKRIKSIENKDSVKSFENSNTLKDCLETHSTRAKPQNFKKFA